DWIVMKCLEKDRARRYDTVNGLALDIEKHLNNEPVVARPPSVLYRLQKSARRHRVAFAAGAAIALTFVLAVIISTLEAVRATHAERQARLAQANEAAKLRRAEDSAANSRKVARFLKQTLQGVASATSRDRKVLQSILDMTAGSLGAELKDQPEV